MIELTILGVAFSLLLFYGVPVSFCIGIATLLALFNVTPDVTTALVVSAQRMTSSLDSFTLVAIPLFILAGSMMNTGGIALRLIDFAKVIVGRLPGSLAHITCLSNALFGAVSGSAVAAAAAVGATLSPLQRKEGYDMPFCAATNVASSPGGLLIPPSGALIVYSLISGGTPVDVLFVAGYVPGILMAVSVMLWIAWKAYKGEMPPVVHRYTVSEATKITLRAIPALFLIVIIMGGIIAGIFTATEAAGVAALYTFILGRFFYKSLSWSALVKSTLDAAVGTAVVMLMVGVSSAVARCTRPVSTPTTSRARPSRAASSCRSSGGAAMAAVASASRAARWRSMALPAGKIGVSPCWRNSCASAIQRDSSHNLSSRLVAVSRTT